MNVYISIGLLLSNNSLQAILRKNISAYYNSRSVVVDIRGEISRVIRHWTQAVRLRSDK